MLAGISSRDLVNEKPFNVVADSLNAWFRVMIGDSLSAVLVSHNTCTDIQFLDAEYIRAGMQLPPQFRLGLDTLLTLKRFASLCYRKVAPEDWPLLTDKGKLSMGIKPTATYALRHLDPPQLFEAACGAHHDADADTKGVAVILFDYKMFNKRGLYHCVFKSGKKCFQPLSEIWDAMEIKVREPVVKLEPSPPGWLLAEVGDKLVHEIIHTHLFKKYLSPISLKTRTTIYHVAVPNYLKVLHKCARRHFVLLQISVVKVNHHIKCADISVSQVEGLAPRHHSIRS